MGILHIVFTTFIIYLTLATPTKILESINKQRYIHSERPITYNYTLQNALVKFNQSIDWYYTNSNYTYHYPFIKIARKWNGDFIMNLPQFTKFRDDGWQWLFRDRTFETVDYIIKFRIRQSSCFEWSKCSRTTFYDYMTCLKSFPEIPDIAHKPCSWCFQYYPLMINRKLEQISCIKLYNKGHNPIYSKTGDNKPMCFFCYGKLSRNVTNDLPF